MTSVYAAFREQLARHPGRWYETSLPWKGNHSPLPNNKAVSLQRLGNLQNRRQRLDVTESYGEIIEKTEVLGNSRSRKGFTAGKRILHTSQAGDPYCRIGISTIGNYLD